MKGDIIMELVRKDDDKSEILTIREIIDRNLFASFALFQTKLDFEQTKNKLKQLHLENTLMEQELYQVKIELYETKLELRLLELNSEKSR